MAYTTKKEPGRLNGNYMPRWPLNRQKCTLPVTSETGLERQEEMMQLKEPDDGARSWERFSPTYAPENEKCNLQRGRMRQEEHGRSESETGSYKARVKRE